MAGHPLALLEDLHGVGGKPDLELLTLQFMGHAVIVIVDFDVVVDVDGGNLPLGIFVGFVRQWQSMGLIEQDKELAARLLEFAQSSVVQTLQQLTNGTIEVGQSVELSVA